MTRDEIAALIEESPAGIIIPCWVQPKSSRDSIAGIHGEALKIAITAPPVDGKANAHLCKYMAKLAGVSKSSVELISGQASRRKSLLVHGIGKSEFLDRLPL